MKKERKIVWCNTIAFYDVKMDSQTFKKYFEFVEKWAESIQIPWDSIGLPTSRKLILFKNGKKRLEKTDFKAIEDITVLGGVDEPGTNLNWKIYSSIDSKGKGEIVLSFLDIKLGFKKSDLLPLIQNVLKFSEPHYGIVYQRDYTKGPHLYAYGGTSGLGYTDAENKEAARISAWTCQYEFDGGAYRTGLLRDVYPFNILISTHLTETVGSKTLEGWIDSDPRHGMLEKITDTHWLWSIEPENILVAQETLQEAGLLLCYEV